MKDVRSTLYQIGIQTAAGLKPKRGGDDTVVLSAALRPRSGRQREVLSSCA